MTLTELDNLVRTGLLKSEPPDQKEIDGLLDSGRKRLADARIKSLSAESKFELAYGAAHAFALAGMRWHGYRPANRRYVVFQALASTLGIRPQDWRILDKCHAKRNALEYEGTFDVDSQLLADLLTATSALEIAAGKLGPVPRAEQRRK